MNPTFDVFWNAKPDVASELAFLDQLRADLKRAKVSATILANYFTNSRSTQVDFLVVTERHVCHVELKNYVGELHGEKNGPWSIVKDDGATEKLIGRQNPYTQALACKMAISDDMHALARQDSAIAEPDHSRRFYTQFDSVVCIWPRLEDGSQVPGNFKVRTLGYAEFVQFLVTPGQRPAWIRDHWLAMIRMLGLINAQGRSPARLTKNAAQALVDHYVRQFKDSYKNLHELVPLPLTIDAETISLSSLMANLPEMKHVQLIGRSGCGKTHMAKHVLLDLPTNSLVPIFVEGIMYDGRLSTILNRSVAPFTTASANDLLRSAAINGQTILLAIDGFNECPQSLQDRLLRELSAMCRRTKAVTLITAQATVPAPDYLTGQCVYVRDLTGADRGAVLTSYGAPEILHLTAPFTTAYELSIAAECAHEIADVVTRASLFAAFTRKRLHRTRSPAATRERCGNSHRRWMND